jgi:hypothetical protein
MTGATDRRPHLQAHSTARRSAQEKGERDQKHDEESGQHADAFQVLLHHAVIWIEFGANRGLVLIPEFFCHTNLLVLQPRKDNDALVIN